mmetsp:Transcript_1218/g.2817  ORF Transcript_1218/g.2817 Transcript_1218/m.2817 type:complete len:98 (+) Transcript_1218:805-1098(+)
MSLKTTGQRLTSRDMYLDHGGKKAKRINPQVQMLQIPIPSEKRTLRKRTATSQHLVYPGRCLSLVKEDGRNDVNPLDKVCVIPYTKKSVAGLIFAIN